MFKKNDYIVTTELHKNFYTNCAKENYCFKQRIDSESIHPCLDLEGSRSNGNDTLLFNKSGNLKNWRYATKNEIDEYNILGKPFYVYNNFLTVMDNIDKLIEKWK